MKKIMSFAFLLFTVFIIGALSACSSSTKSASGFTFEYETNSAQKQVVSEQDCVVITLKVKNDNREQNILKAEKFVLVKDGENVSFETFFGNNIVDQMYEEILDGGESETLTLNLKINSDVQGKMILTYEQTELFTIRI